MGILVAPEAQVELSNSIYFKNTGKNPLLVSETTARLKYIQELKQLLSDQSAEIDSDTCLAYCCSASERQT